MVRVIPLRLDNEVLSFVDMLIDLGVYSSRSEALRDLIKIGIEEYRWMTRVYEAIEKLFKLEDEELRRKVERLINVIDLSQLI